MNGSSISRILLAAALTVAIAAGGCKRKGPVLQDDSLTPSPSASVISIVNVIGACDDDLALCERECDAGAADRCRRLGVTYEFGRGADKDEGKATRYFELACGMGNAPACVSAGQMYEYHHGVAKDDAKAAGFYKKACDIGWVVGCANWGIMLENGRGVPKDLAAARAVYASACDAGAGLACDRLKSVTPDGG